jgi:arylsulfatase A-like enzyme
MRSFFKYVFLLTIVFFTESCTNRTVEKEPKSDENIKPNVLLIYMDDLRPQLGCYGNKVIKSPHIDNFASGAVLFNEAYCNVPVCGASRASMLTGMYPNKNRFINYDTFVSKEEPGAVSFPLLFKKNGYTTISNGKIYHHLDDNMSDWDEVWRPYAFEKNDLGLAPTDYWQSLWKDYHLPENITLYKNTGTGPAYESAPVNDSTYIDGLMASKVIRDIKKLKKSKKPFLLTAGFISNHLPFNAPEHHWKKYTKEDIHQPYNNFIPKNAPAISISNWWEMRAYTGIPKKGQVDDAKALKLIHGYDATVSYVDQLIGNILEALKKEGLDKNTIVILVADHGYSLQEHTQWAKYNPYRDASHVPLMIRTPGMKTGKVTNALVELVDIYPTLAELCGLTPPEDQLDGKSIVDILKHPKKTGKAYVFTKTANAFTIKTKDFAYTEFIDLKNYKTITRMLYDHQKDPDENINVVDDKAYEKVVDKLKKILHTKYNSNITGEL